MTGPTKDVLDRVNELSRQQLEASGPRRSDQINVPIEKHDPTGIFAVLDVNDRRRYITFPHVFKTMPNFIEALKVQDMSLPISDLQFEYTDLEVHKPPDDG